MDPLSVSQVTWQDVQQAPDDGKRREAIGGELYVTPAPGVRHQRISGRLESALRRLLHHHIEQRPERVTPEVVLHILVILIHIRELRRRA